MFRLRFFRGRLTTFGIRFYFSVNECDRRIIVIRVVNA